MTCYLLIFFALNFSKAVNPFGLPVVVAVLVLGAIALIAALVLFGVSKKFAVEEDPRLGQVGGILLMKTPLNGRGSGSIQEVLKLRGIKTRTGFLNARQIAMTQDGTDARKTVVKFLNQMLHRLLLLRSAGVADAARWRKTTLVTDAYAVRIVTDGMRAHTLYLPHKIFLINYLLVMMI